MSEVTKPPRGPINIVVHQEVISKRALWEEASRFRNFLHETRQLDPDTTLPEADDVRWTIFFILVARYVIQEQNYLHQLLADRDDIPF